jgi:hypothetical protein
MMTIDVSVLPAAEQDCDLWKGGADRYDYSRLPAEMRSQAMLAQGTVVEGLSSAVRRVVEAGQALSWAKAELPHGEYLPWVQQACGLKPQRAAELIKAFDWVQMSDIAGTLEGVTDANVLFLLSADTTPEEVREWFMDRCAAGDPPSRKEVQERKRSAGQPRQPQPLETLALNLIRKGEVERLREALTLAERAEVVTADQVMAEQRLRELGKLRYIAGMEADFHRMKDGSWVRLPHAGDVDVSVVAEVSAEPAPSPPAWDAAPLLSIGSAARRLNMKEKTLTQCLTPSSAARRNGAPFVRNGFKVTREGLGKVRLTPVAP